jgi:hypothetical protein
MRNAYTISAAKPEGNRSLGRPRNRYEDNSDMKPESWNIGDRETATAGQRPCKQAKIPEPSLGNESTKMEAVFSMRSAPFFGGFYTKNNHAGECQQ